MAQVDVTGKRQRDAHGESPEPKRSSSKTSKEKRVRRQLWTSESGREAALLKRPVATSEMTKYMFIEERT